MRIDEFNTEWRVPKSERIAGTISWLIQTRRWLVFYYLLQLYKSSAATMSLCRGTWRHKALIYRVVIFRQQKTHLCKRVNENNKLY